MTSGKGREHRLAEALNLKKLPKNKIQKKHIGVLVLMSHTKRGRKITY